MGKALLVAASLDTLASSEETTLFGYTNANSAVARSRGDCTEAATFSNLGVNVIAGNSGTLTLRFLVDAAAGQQVVSFAGTGAGEDTTNSDVLSAGQDWQLGYTDTGTDSTIAWLRGNVAFSSGHGNFHGSANMAAPIFDAASATRFISLAGNLGADGDVTEDNAEWKVRGYDSFEAFQVRVLANARLNDSTFRNRINGADGTGVVTFATLVTGLLIDTAIGDAITDGQTINASITLGAGVEDLTVTFVCATLKSSTSKSETWTANIVNIGRTASATAHYVPIGGNLFSLTAFTEAQARLKPGFAAVVSNLRCYLSANTYASNGTLKLYQNGVAVITLTLTASGGAGWYENTTDTITIDDNDELSFEFDEGGASGSINIHSAGITFAPVAGAAVTRMDDGWLRAIRRRRG